MKNSLEWGYDATPYIWKPIIKMGGSQNYMIRKEHLIEQDLMIKDIWFLISQ